MDDLTKQKKKSTVRESEVDKNIFVFTCEQSRALVYFQSFYISQKFVLPMYTDIHCRNSPINFNPDLKTFINPTL